MAARFLALLLPLAIGASCSDGEQDADPPETAAASIPIPSEARLAVLDESLVKAIREGAATLEFEPANHRAWLVLGMTYEAHSMHEEALPCYREAARLEDTDPKAWLRLGQALTKAGELPLAIASFERLLALDDDYDPARLRLGFLHLDAGDPASARRVFQVVLDRTTPRSAVALQGQAQCDLDEGQPQAALDRLAGDSLLEGVHRPLTQRLRGQAYARLGKSAEAEAALAEGIAAKPSIQDPWSREVNQFKVGLSALIMRAQKQVDRGKGAAALKLIEAHRRSGDPRVLRLMGAAYAREKRYADAAVVLAEAFLLEPDDPDLALALAAAYSEEMRTGEATKVLDVFVDRAPQHIAPWRGLQELSFKIGAFPRAIGVRNEARQAGHADGELELTAALAAMALEQYTGAVESFDAAEAAGVATAKLYLGRARANIELEQFDEAGDDLVEAAVLDPSHPALMGVRSLWEERRGQ